MSHERHGRPAELDPAMLVKVELHVRPSELESELLIDDSLRQYDRSVQQISETTPARWYRHGMVAVSALIVLLVVTIYGQRDALWSPSLSGGVSGDPGDDQRKTESLQDEPLIVEDTAGIMRELLLHEVEWIKPEGEDVLAVTRLGEGVIAPGQVTVLYLWATWCKPCKSELADLREIFKRSSWDDRVRFASILSQDAVSPRAAHRDFAAKMPSADFFLAESSSSDTTITDALRKRGSIQVGPLPGTVVLDCRRKVRYVHSGRLEPRNFEELEGKIEALVAELSTSKCSPQVAARFPSFGRMDLPADAVAVSDPPPVCRSVDVQHFLGAISQHCKGDFMACPDPEIENLMLPSNTLDQVLTKFPETMMVHFPTGYPPIQGGGDWPTAEVSAYYRERVASPSMMQALREARHVLLISRSSDGGSYDENLKYSRVRSEVIRSKLLAAASVEERERLEAKFKSLTLGSRNAMTATLFRGSYANRMIAWSVDREEFLRAQIVGYEGLALAEKEGVDNLANQAVFIVPIPCDLPGSAADWPKH